MIHLPNVVRVFVHSAPVDMRKSFDTLTAVVRVQMNGDIYKGDVFVFVGRRRKHAKVLWWDGTGLVLLSKRLVKGHFAPPWAHRGQALRWTVTELALFLEGSELVGRQPLSPPPFDPSERRIEFQ